MGVRERLEEKIREIDIDEIKEKRRQDNSRRSVLERENLENWLYSYSTKTAYLSYLGVSNCDISFNLFDEYTIDSLLFHEIVKYARERWSLRFGIMEESLLHIPIPCDDDSYDYESKAGKIKNIFRTFYNDDKEYLSDYFYLSQATDSLVYILYEDALRSILFDVLRSYIPSKDSRRELWDLLDVLYDFSRNGYPPGSLEPFARIYFAIKDRKIDEEEYSEKEKKELHRLVRAAL
jgi:hypothetical protein